MAKLNWYKKAISTQHRRFQNDYAGNMGVRHRKFMAEQTAEEEKIKEEALAEEERLEKKIRAEMLMNGGMPPDPNWANLQCLDLLDQGNTI